MHSQSICIITRIYLLSKTRKTSIVDNLVVNLDISLMLFRKDKKFYIHTWNGFAVVVILVEVNSCYDPNAAKIVLFWIARRLNRGKLLYKIHYYLEKENLLLFHL